MVFECVFA